MAPSSINFPGMDYQKLRLKMAFDTAIKEEWKVKVNSITDKIGHVNRELFTAVFRIEGGDEKKIACLPGTLALSTVEFCGVHYQGIWKQDSVRLYFLWAKRRGLCEDGITRFVTWNRFWKPTGNCWDFVQDAKGEVPFPEDDFGIFLEGPVPQ